MLQVQNMKQCYLVILFLIIALPFTGSAQNAPLEFIENRGQWDGPFVYKSSNATTDVFLEKGGFTYLVAAPENGKLVHNYKHNEIATPPTLRYHAYKVTFEGSSSAVTFKDSKRQPHYYNYYLGKNPDKWKTDIHPALNVDYRELYPGVDIHVASQNQRLKYDFIIKAGVDPEIIRLRYEGADGLEVKKNALEIKTSVGTITELEPYAYQYIDGERKEVPCKYRIRNNIVSFYFPKGYDNSHTLIIDPTVVFASYSGSFADNWGFTATYDNQGNFYAGGIAGGTGYPVSVGAFQTNFAGGGTGGNPLPWDISITKFTPTGGGIVYSTYLGGTDNEQPHSMVVDANDNLIVVGRTYSTDFPMQNSYDNTHNGSADIIVAKFNSTGTALAASTYVGGAQDEGVNISSNWSTITGLKHNYGDDARSEVIVDNVGNVYVAASTNSINFPTANATQTGLQGLQDGVVFKLTNNLGVLAWSTYLGGSADDAAYVLALNVAQSHLFVSGGTSSSNFPSTAGTFHPSYMGGSADGFIVKFQNSGAYTLQRGTFIGQSSYDQCYGVQVDGNNAVYAMGQTHGGTFPVTPGVYVNPNSSQFVIKLDSNLTNNIYSTVFGSGNSAAANISPVAFLVDTCEQVYISGWGGPLSGNGGSTTGMPITPNAADTVTDGSDFYFIVLDKDAVGLLYGTYYGASTLGEHVDGGTSRFDKNGVVYQGICAGCGASSAFPTTAGSHSQTNNSPNCNYGALKIAFQLSVVSAVASAGPSTTGCPPLVVNFTNSSTNGATYLWDFGDGSPTSTAYTPPAHTYNTPGTYTVRLIVSNPSACNVTVDTATLTIQVDANSINADFTYKVTDSCGPYAATFTNTSQEGTPATATQYTWSFGDNTTFNGKNPPPHSYPDTGCYTVRLIMQDQNSCNKADTVTKIVCIHGFLLKAAFNSPDSVCLNAGLLFANASVNAQTILWNFGDGQTSNAASPVHIFANTGTYTITLIVNNPNSCNKSDTVQKTITIKSLPIADFIYDPIIPVANMPVTFTNKSQNAVSYVWSFGDGTTSTIVHPQHLYKRTGTYTVCLEATSVDGCRDTICKKVDAEIHPAVDVPTGFSPNGDGTNDVLYVRGAAIETVNFKVFNRWGELVFETNDMKRGWDGNFKGKQQEMDSYAWVLDVMFIDESTVHRTGNVTLLR
jgi:gliding motility-associated-like protein